jgi:PhoH-like ATPase
LFFSAPAVQIGGKDKYGYVPGSLEEKVSIYAGGFLDNLAFLSSTDRIDKNNIVFDKIHIEILPLNLLRGRSLKNTIIILDESQNATLDELQAILTR